MPARAMISASAAEPLLAAAIDYVARRATRQPCEAALTALTAAVEAQAPGALSAATGRLLEPRWSGNPPEWAKGLVRRHALGKVSELIWRRSRTKSYTSGRCRYGDKRLVVTASAGRTRIGEVDGARRILRDVRGRALRETPDELEQRVIVLHEISHALRPWHGHDEIFFDQFYALLQAESLVKVGLAHGQARSLRAAGRRARRG